MANASVGRLMGWGNVIAIEAVRYNGAAMSGNRGVVVAPVPLTNGPCGGLYADGSQGTIYCGKYKLVGQVKNNVNVGYQACVIVTPQDAPSFIVAGGGTDASGNFEFTGLAAGLYRIAAIDKTGAFNGAGFDFVAAVLM
jgi:hypothetical protein